MNNSVSWVNSVISYWNRKGKTYEEKRDGTKGYVLASVVKGQLLRVYISFCLFPWPGKLPLIPNIDPHRGGTCSPTASAKEIFLFGVSIASCSTCSEDDSLHGYLYRTILVPGTRYPTDVLEPFNDDPVTISPVLKIVSPTVDNEFVIRNATGDYLQLSIDCPKYLVAPRSCFLPRGQSQTVIVPSDPTATPEKITAMTVKAKFRGEVGALLMS